MNMDYPESWLQCIKTWVMHAKMAIPSCRLMQYYPTWWRLDKVISSNSADRMIPVSPSTSLTYRISSVPMLFLQNPRQVFEALPVLFLDTTHRKIHEGPPRLGRALITRLPSFPQQLFDTGVARGATQGRG